MSSFNPGGPPPPKKETVYDGPDHYAVSSSGNPTPQAAAPAVKKETVYGQSQPPMAGFGTPPPPPLKQETVFGGPMPNTLPQPNMWQPQQQQPQQQSAAVQAAYEAGLAGVSRYASWFFWIAGLSLINTISLMSGANFIFIAGLGITVFLGAAAHLANNNTVQIGAAVISLIAAGAFVGLGVFARKAAQWAFIVGMIFYVLDTVLVLVIQEWFMLLFHGYVLYRLWSGYSQCRKLEELRVMGSY